jgi:hypothetical protein
MQAKSRLANLVKLSHVVRLYVPSTVDVDIEIDTQEYVDNTVKQFSEWFGGATAYNALGGWWDGSKVVYEKVTIVESHAKNIDDDSIYFIIDWAEQMKKDLRQQAIAFEKDGELYLV